MLCSFRILGGHSLSQRLCEGKIVCLLFSYHGLKRPCSAVISGGHDTYQSSLELCPRSLICSPSSPMLLFAQPAACPQHMHNNGTSHKVQGQGKASFTSSDVAAQIRKSGIKGDTSHLVLCVVTRAALRCFALPAAQPRPAAAQASQTLNHVVPT